MAEWYLFDGVDQLGPLDRRDLDDRIRRHSNPSAVRVWRDGFSDWKTVEEALDAGPASASEPALSQRPHDHSGEAKRWNFVARHWRGEFPLGISYWVVGNLSNIFAVFVIGLATALNQGSYDPFRLFLFYVLVWAFVTVLAIWQLVGIWRSAQRRRDERLAMGKRAVWAGIAKLVVCLGVLNTAFVLIRTGIPQISEATSVAFFDDPRIPPYAIKLLNNGSEVEISGGIKFGLSNDFERILNASSGVRTVHLDSVGGRIGEGKKLNAMIRGRGLDTYVQARCLSACTLVFVAGRQRVLKKGAQLGFHRAAFAGDDKLDDSAERSIYRTAGVPGAFIDRALATSNASIWIPTEAELLAAGVVTRISSGDEYAVAGIEGKLTRDGWDKALQKSAQLYQVLKAKYPATYDEVLDIFVNGASRGLSQAEVVGQTRTKIGDLTRKLLPLADDAVLIDFGRLVLDQYTAIQAQDKAACYKYASGQPDQNVIKMIPAPLAEREVDLNARIIRSTQVRADSVNNDRSWEKIRAGLSRKGYAGRDLEMLTGETIGEADYARYCDLAVALYQEITALPSKEAAAVLREFLS
ncbi:DUF4339 domain-containing protein [Bradyrhizobium manausense]|uniref:GYF domain-containing protein n=1 Tax=Bradyrhizobium manausense TaxID=989370 RepID=UPI001BAE279F|nr:GYF domain-containing protein [Bradyrhizobium manausense]MBR1092483.1 DUF4339 domain-containing protein [Bradyrhizobium manausense]